MEDAIEYVEDSGLMFEHYPDERDRDRLMRRMDRLIKQAQRDQPLAWQAYEARQRRKPVVGVLEAARRITVMRELGVLATVLHENDQKRAEERRRRRARRGGGRLNCA